MNKKITIAILVLAILTLAGIFSVRESRATDGDFYPSFVERLAQKFNLNQNEVKAFFDEARQEKQQLMIKNREERLNQAVADGVITEEQKQVLLTKLEEKMKERQQHREEMRAWMEQQGINWEKLAPYGGFGHRGFGHWHMGIK